MTGKAASASGEKKKDSDDNNNSNKSDTKNKEEEASGAGSKEADTSSSTPGNNNDEEEEEDAEAAAEALSKAEADARRVAEAAAEADSQYVPTQSVLNAKEAGPLLDQVDGPPLSSYQTVDNVYQAKGVPVPSRDQMDVPIHVSAGGSVVEYSITCDVPSDVGIGIKATREDGQVIVRKLQRVDAHLEPAAGKFLVGSVPCELVFTFDNSYSWFKEKFVSYKITVTPPAMDGVLKGRRRRAQSALKTISEDCKSAEGRLSRATAQRTALQASIQKLQRELEEKQASLAKIETDESYLQTRVDVRNQQMTALHARLQDGWEDEKEWNDKQQQEQDKEKETK